MTKHQASKSIRREQAKALQRILDDQMEYAEKLYPSDAKHGKGR